MDPYDILPYPDVVVRSTMPAHVGAIGLLLGTDSPPVNTILELGCGTGANTRAIAQDWPNARVIGIDRSARQIQIAKEASKDIPNVTFIEADLMAPDAEQFSNVDYLICHGVYSWVPAPVQNRIMQLMSQALSPKGIGLISFNTLPGWHVKLPLREILRFHTAGIDDILEKIDQAKMVMQLILDGIAHPDAPLSIQLRELCTTMQKVPDSYLLHEFLCDCNEPILFEEFARRLAGANLQYVGDADFGANVPAAISDETKSIITEISGTRERFEQYLDFLMYKTFRRAMIVRDNVEVTGRFTSKSLTRLRFKTREGIQRDDPAWTALHSQDWSTVEQLAEKIGGELIPAVSRILTAVAEGWMEVKMIQ